MDYLTAEALHDLATLGRLSDQTVVAVKEHYASDAHRTVQFQYQLELERAKDADSNPDVTADAERVKALEDELSKVNKTEPAGRTASKTAPASK